jgi:hypothetical protein
MRVTLSRRAHSAPGRCRHAIGASTGKHLAARISYMNLRLRISLLTTPEQAAKLHALQRVFAEACNALAPIARDNMCWNRVALHHLAYRGMRERFPGLGSQMICNVIYSVSRMCRLVYQHPASPFNVARLRGAGLL